MEDGSEDDDQSSDDDDDSDDEDDDSEEEHEETPNKVKYSYSSTPLLFCSQPVYVVYHQAN